MFEKILKQLEEEREIASADFEKYVEEIEPELDEEHDDWFHRGLERAKIIIREAVRLYGKETNVLGNGWIPCSSKILPEKDGVYLCTIARYSKDGEKIIDSVGFATFCGGWVVSQYDKVTAWQEKPRAYQDGEQKPYCSTCRYYESDTNSCSNGYSQYWKHIRCFDDTCEHWEQKGE